MIVLLYIKHIFGGFDCGVRCFLELFGGLIVVLNPTAPGIFVDHNLSPIELFL